MKIDYTYSFIDICVKLEKILLRRTMDLSWCISGYRSGEVFTVTPFESLAHQETVMMIISDVDIKNDAWVTVNNEFWVTSEAICQ